MQWFLKYSEMPHNEEGKTVDPDELSTTNTKLLNNYF
jgi:hypothetical protein